jgi:hypothetical protein
MTVANPWADLARDDQANAGFNRNSAIKFSLTNLIKVA